ncbi:DsbA family protein [Alsobacter sp. R-9]
MILRPFRLAAGALAVTLATAALVSQARAQDFTDKQKAAIGEIVKDFLIKNPEVIQDALIELDRRQKEQERVALQGAIKDLQPLLTGADKNIVVGNPQGDVTIVEFTDYNCPYCRRSVSDLRELLKGDPKLRLVIRDFPLQGQDSIEAAQVSLAVKNQFKADKFWDFHVRLMESKSRVGKAQALALAKEMGADMTRVAKDMDGPEIQAKLQETMRMADMLKLSGTPSYVIGEDIVMGAVGTDQLRANVTAMRQCGRTAC